MNNDLFEEVKGIISGIPLKTGDKIICIPCVIKNLGCYIPITEPLVGNLYYEGCCRISNPSGNGYDLFNLVHPDGIIKLNYHNIVEFKYWQWRSIEYLVEDYDLYFGITDLWKNLVKPTELPIEVIEKFVADTGINSLAQHNGGIYKSNNIKYLINWKYKNYSSENIAEYFRDIFTDCFYQNIELLYIEASKKGLINNWSKYLPDLIRFRNFREIIDFLGIHKNPNGFLDGNREVYKNLLEYLYKITLSKI